MRKQKRSLLNGEQACTEASDIKFQHDKTGMFRQKGKGMRIDQDGIPNIDMPLLSPRRIWKAFRLWLWLVAVQEVDVPFWLFIIWSQRPNASHKAGKY